MSADQTEGAVNNVENKVASTGGDARNSQVVDEVNAALTSPIYGNIINNPEATQTFATRLEKEGILPAMVINEFQAGKLDQWKTGENLDRAKIEAAANDPNQSPLNRMMAQALLRRYKELDTTPGDGVSRAELEAWRGKPTTTEDGSTVYRDAQGRPTRIVHPTTEGEPPRETLIKRDAQGNPIQIIPPPGSAAIPLEMKDGKWQVTNNPDRNSEISNVVVLPDGTYKFDTKKTNGSDSYTVTQKTDLSRILTSSNGNVFQVDRNVADLRSFKATPRDNPTEITLNEGKTTFKKEGDVWVNQGKRDEVYSSITAAPDGTVTMTRPDKTATVYNTDRSVVQLDGNGQPQSIKYANGKESQFQYENGKLVRVVENGVSKPLTGGVVDRGGNYSYIEGGKRVTIHSTGKRSEGMLEAAAPVEPAPAPVVQSDTGAGGSKIEVTEGGNKIVRTNAGGKETETITKSGDRYTIERKGADGSTTTEFAKPGTFKPEMKDGKMVGYTYTTEGGAEVKQNADGSREYKDPSGATTKYTYGADGQPNKIERTGKGGVTETLTRGTNGEWNLSRSDNAGGKVDAVRINSDGSYSYIFMGTLNTQETQRNIREAKLPNGDALRISFDKDGKPESVVRNYKVGEQQHQEQVKMTDGKWQVTIDGKPVDAKDIKVHAGGGYEYTRNDNGTKIYQDGKTRRETRPDGFQIEKTVLPSGDTQSKLQYANGDTHTLTAAPNGKPKSIVHTTKETGLTETVSFDAEGKPTGIAITDAANPNKKLEAKNFTMGADGTYKYDLPVDPANPNKVRHIEQKRDGSRTEVTREPYVVQPNDALDKLAKQRGVSRQDIIDAQPEELRARLTKNPNLIFKGETLIMPSDKKEIKGPAATPIEGTPQPAAGDREEYTVRPNDSLTKIANDRKLTVDALIAEIKGFDPELGKRLEGNRDLIFSGEKLPVRKRK